MQHLLGINENKQKTEMFFHIQYCVHCDISIKEKDHNEVNAIQDLLQCSRSSAYSQLRTASTNCGHLITQVKNISVKWSIKPRIVRTKIINKALRKETVEWIMKN